MQVLFATFFGIAIMGDSVSWLGIFGSLMIAAGVVLANASKSVAIDKSMAKLPGGEASANQAEHKLLDANAGHLVMPHYSAGQHLMFASPGGLSKDGKLEEGKAGMAVASHDIVVELSPLTEQQRASGS